MGRFVVAVVILCLGALALAPSTEAQRKHTGFSARTYYESNETSTMNTTKNSTVVAPNRYEHGYPDQVHRYNSVTGKYETVEKGTMPNRYANGYPGTTKHFNPKTQQFEAAEVTGPAERYVNGYYGESTTKYDPKGTATTVKSSASYYTVSDKNTSSDPGSFPDRYTAGYPRTLTTPLPSSAKPISNTNPASRYEFGYYEHSTYAGSANKRGVSQYDPKPVTYSSFSGNFNTLPYPSVGVPFVESGAGCRTSYWATHVDYWPSFFTIKSTIEDAFGTKAAEVYGQTTILQALLNYKTDGYSQLEKSGCTSLLNSYSRGRFATEHMKVIELFNAALVSSEAAAAQALAFETANVESISAGSPCT